MGESQSRPFQLSFNRFLRVAFQGSRVTSDGGLILVRELDERFGLSELIGQHLVDSRTGRNRQFPLTDLLRQSVYSRLAGYEDLNDPPGTEGCRRKPDGKAAVSSFGTRVEADRTLSQAPGPAKAKLVRWNPSRGVQSGAVGS